MLEQFDRKSRDFFVSVSFYFYQDIRHYHFTSSKQHANCSNERMFFPDSSCVKACSPCKSQSSPIEMNVARNTDELKRALTDAPRPCVLVPTMGAFHPGHISLMREARKIAGTKGTVVVSIFVNPIQFDRASDLDAYPRPITSDLATCEASGVDVAFVPAADTMYFPDRSVTVTENLLSHNLCGASRPGHFDGVCTVVLKLFLLTGCDVSLFGEKDFQQLAIIRRMVRDLDVPVKIIPCPTVREPDGLAMSSRNTRLRADQRADAPRIRHALLAASDFTSAEEMITSARSHITASSLARIDYLSLVDAETLQPVASLDRPSILAAAVFYDEVRLIDHLTIPAKS